MTLLPAVREQIEIAAARRVQARRGRRIGASLAGRPQISLGAVAALAASLALILGSWTAGHPRSERAFVAPPGAAEVFTPATPALLQAATDFRWTPRGSETIP